jgi:hypothetical protein
MFKFDPDKFQKQLDMNHLLYMSNLSPGMFRILDFVFGGTPTRRVNFDSFTREEMESVVEFANDYHCADDYDSDVDDDINDENWGNAVHEYLRCIELQNTLAHTKNKILDEEDDFL